MKYRLSLTRTHIFKSGLFVPMRRIVHEKRTLHLTHGKTSERTWFYQKTGSTFRSMMSSFPISEWANELKFTPLGWLLVLYHVRKNQRDLTSGSIIMTRNISKNWFYKVCGTSIFDFFVYSTRRLSWTLAEGFVAFSKLYLLAISVFENCLSVLRQARFNLVLQVVSLTVLDRKQWRK